MTTLSITRAHDETEVEIEFIVTVWGYGPDYDDPGAPPEVEITGILIDDQRATPDQFERLLPWAEEFIPDMIDLACDSEYDAKVAEAERRADERAER